MFTCPNGKEVAYWGFDQLNKQQVYRARVKDCRACMRKPIVQETGPVPVSYHLYENTLEEARRLNTTREYLIAQRTAKRDQGPI
jgi:hypothetical protein